MRLVASQATHCHLDLARARRIQNILHRMTVHRMAYSKPQGKNHDLVFLVVVLGQTDLAVENREYVLRFHLDWPRLGTMAFEAKSVAFGAEQLCVISAVRFMTGCAAQAERRLMMNTFLL